MYKICTRAKLTLFPLVCEADRVWRLISLSGPERNRLPFYFFSRSLAQCQAVFFFRPVREISSWNRVKKKLRPKCRSGADTASIQRYRAIREDRSWILLWDIARKKGKVAAKSVRVSRHAHHLKLFKIIDDQHGLRRYRYESFPSGDHSETTSFRLYYNTFTKRSPIVDSSVKYFRADFGHVWRGESVAFGASPGACEHFFRLFLRCADRTRCVCILLPTRCSRARASREENKGKK